MKPIGLLICVMKVGFEPLRNKMDLLSKSDTFLLHNTNKKHFSFLSAVRLLGVITGNTTFKLNKTIPCLVLSSFSFAIFP